MVGSWSHGIHSPENRERNAGTPLTSSFFQLAQYLVHGIMQYTFGVSLPNSLNPIQKLLYKHAQRLVFMETLNPIKLSIKFNHPNSNSCQVDTQTHHLQAIIFHYLSPKALGHLIMQDVFNPFLKVLIVSKSPNTVQKYDSFVRLTYLLTMSSYKIKNKSHTSSIQ